MFENIINKWKYRKWSLQSIKYYTFNTINTSILNCSRCGKQYPPLLLVSTTITTKGYRGITETKGLRLSLCEKCLREITTIKIK